MRRLRIRQAATSGEWSVENGEWFGSTCHLPSAVQTAYSGCQPPCVLTWAHSYVWRKCGPGSWEIREFQAIDEDIGSFMEEIILAGRNFQAKYRHQKKTLLKSVSGEFSCLAREPC